MNPNNSILVSSSRNPQARFRLFPFTASRVGKLAACLILGVATLSQTARSAPALVGQWLTNSSLADVSGYSPTGTHDGYDIAGTGNFVFTNDPPPGKAGMSLFLWNGDTGIGISNSATGDGTTYTNTFDDQIQNAFTVSCWARGFPASWTPFVSKWGEGPPYNTPEGGWQLRADGNDNYSCFTVRDTNSGALVFGNTGDALDDLATVSQPSNDGGWHFYTGVFSATTGVRSLYVDSVLAAQETGNVPYGMEPDVHVCIGAKETPPGGTFGSFSTMEVYDVRIYNYALSQGEIGQLNGIPAGTPAQIITQPPTNITASCEGITVQIYAQSAGSLPITNQWTLNGTNLANGTLPDGAIISGANSASLTIANITTNEQGVYVLTVANAFGSPAVSRNTTLTVGTLIPAPAPAGRRTHSRWSDRR